MGKSVFIGDIHGRDGWKRIVEENEDADNIVFIGDYFDSFDISGLEQLNNAKDIVEFKKFRELDPTKKVYLLIGNHDHHYLPGVKWKGSTSGFQSPMLTQFEMFFVENKDMFQMSVLIDNILCTHAGVSSEFLKDTGYWTYDNHKDESHVADFINDLFKHKPNEFSFDSFMERNPNIIPSPYGDDEGQSPIWIRPRSLQRSNQNTDLKKNYVQVVGHTVQVSIDIKGKTTGGKYYYIDALGKGQYLLNIDGNFELGILN